MHDRDKYKTLKLEKGELVDRIKNKKQKDWIHVCEVLGIRVSTSFGNGSHAAAYKDDCPVTDSKCCIVTLPREIYPSTQRDLFKKILYHGVVTKKYTEDDIWRALGVL